ncbi:GNAT family N-acetyltransferase [Cellulomonas sp. FA1]|uniref:GNAT family N-acetyltransferase n=1 Tax=Cellulomonas sp. FA1 TaxID=1346710 RepID=UPI00069A8536|nr:GNAT family N-acetyltransferase [Cellulomonas sp. FA1]
MTDGLLARLPAALRSRRDVLSDRERWAAARVVASDDHAAVLVRDAGGPAVWAVGDSGSLATLLPPALVAHAAGARWVTAPRDVPVPPEALAAAGVVPRTSWDRLTTAAAPRRVAGEDAVRALDPDRDTAAIAACLDAANPATHARPGADDDAAWWGVEGEHDDLLGVIGVAWRGGVAGDRSVHLHGLGVVPAARGRGLGTALTAVATRRALEGGAPWASLGMYADNAAARHVYLSLGFAVDAENVGYGPPGAERP